jgi:hypothetical protein
MNRHKNLRRRRSKRRSKIRKMIRKRRSRIRRKRNRTRRRSNPPPPHPKEGEFLLLPWQERPPQTKASPSIILRAADRMGEFLSMMCWNRARKIRSPWSRGQPKPHKHHHPH